MSKKIYFITILAVAVISLSMIIPYPKGAPAGNTGSPADGNTCASCHKVTQKEKVGMIKINAPDNEYIPGKTYTITASASGSSYVKRIGFEISPQSKEGKLLGKLIVTNASETKLIGADDKYITHTSAGSQANGSKIWQFNWEAPPKGTGNVIFYGAFMVSEKNQIVYTSTLGLTEKK